jgi:NAD-dependent SIR2 family protein deacetylase
MVDRGFTHMYQFIGHKFDDKQVQWGYISRQVMLARFEWPSHPVYERLRELVAARPSFIITTNADGMFEQVWTSILTFQRGFPMDKVYTPQGDYSLLQCLSRCTEAVWPSRPIFEKIRANLDGNGRVCFVLPANSFFLLHFH